MTVWVAQTLHKNGRVFLIDAFRGNAELADSVNHLLVVGFYLINVGFISLFLKTKQNLEGLRDGIELFSGKFGVVLVILGIMHFFNLYVFSKIRKRAKLGQAPPPIPPQGTLPLADQ
ncbi:MAG: hypothetical protein AAF558_12320 [Verrucomicrobiota bacterium]